MSERGFTPEDAFVPNTKREKRDAEKYFDIFHGGVHNMSEMGVATPAAKALVEDGQIVGQHSFTFNEQGTVLFDISLSVPKEVAKRQRREELRNNIRELRGILPEGPNKR